MTYPWTEASSATLAAYNGWNSVADDNEDKSVALQLTYAVKDRWTANFVYFGGAERGAGGKPWRHTFDVWAVHHPSRAFSRMLHANAGFEIAREGTHLRGAVGDARTQDTVTLGLVTWF